MHEGRGASYLLASVPAGTRLICASAGNFGQAMAYVCRSKGVHLIVYASVNANSFKVERMRDLGAEVRLCGDDFDAAKIEARRVAQAHGIHMVEDSLEPATSEGAGTIGLELAQWTEPLDAVLVALGNGAMITGVGLWLKKYSPATQVVAVAAAGAPSMVESWRSGTIVEHSAVDTIADGIAVRVPIPEAVADMNGTVDDALLIRDETMLAGMKLLHQHLGLVIEPSAAVGVAALLEDPARFKDQTVATILCGANLTKQQASEWLS